MNDEFLLSNNQDDWGIKDLQNHILHIMKYVDEICKENSINYYLMGGSALGAIRHNGFIPWDDDLDIFMTVEDYKKFKNAFLKKDSKFYLQEWGKTSNDHITMAKVRDSTTTLIENAVYDWNINHGVYIDIFILHKTVNKKTTIKKQLLWSRYLVVKGLATKHYRAKSFSLGLLISILRILPNRFLVKHALNVIYKYDEKNGFKADYYFHFLGRAGLKQGLYESMFFGVPSVHKFEKLDLFVPSDLEKYILQRWGKNYMEPPNIEGIKHMQHPSYVDLKNPYYRVQKKVVSSKDESKLIL